MFIYAAYPCYSNPNAASARQFWTRMLNPQGKRVNVPYIQDPHGSSLLADCFNWHWSVAWNLRKHFQKNPKEGKPITHFVMLHNDVVPPDFWLDTLLDDMEATGADIVSAAVAIKDVRGLTSTAIDDPKDPWDVLRRITATELHKLPEVFTAGDAGYPNNHLLANTGCWVADMRKPWVDEVDSEGFLKAHFHIDSKIKVLPDGTSRTVVRPEDWNFSRHVQEMGGKVMVSRRVITRHIGEFPYPTDAPWGEQQYDQHLSHKFQDPIGSELPTVAGWLTTSEAAALSRLAKGKIVLEVGSYAGKSTICLARTANMVFAVDTFEGTGTEVPRDTLQEFVTNLKRFKVETQVRAYKGRSEEVVPTLGSMFDMAFIDGSHDYLAVKKDIEVCLGALNPCGILVFHDYREQPGEVDGHWDQGVTNAVNELLLNGGELLERVDTIAVIRPAGFKQNHLDRDYQQIINRSTSSEFKEQTNGQRSATTTTATTAEEQPALSTAASV